MRNGKLELAMYYFFDRTWLEGHFERMARKGWALDRMGVFWHYHRIEPRTLHYAVSYFTGGGYYEPPSEEEITFEEYCAEAGWELVAEYGVMKIFCNEREKPVPLETQADVQVQNTHLALRRMRINYGIVGVVGGIVGIWFLLCLLQNFAGQFSNGLGCTLGICGLSLAVYAASDFILYFLWYRKARKNAAENQSFTPTKGNRMVLILTLVVIPLAACGIYLISQGLAGMIGWFTVVACGIVYYIQDQVRNRLRKNGTSGSKNVAVNFFISFAIFEIVFVGGMYVIRSLSSGAPFQQHGFYWENSEKLIPLAAEDLLPEQELPVSDYLQSLHTQSSLFLSQLTAEQIPEESWQEEEGEPFYLQYVLTKVQAGFLYDLTRDSMMKVYSGEQGWQESQEWNLSDGTVEQVYETSVQEALFPLNRYIVCMGDRVLKIDLNFVPDSRQQETIVKILEAV